MNDSNVEIFVPSEMAKTVQKHFLGLVIVRVNSYRTIVRANTERKYR